MTDCTTWTKQELGQAGERFAMDMLNSKLMSAANGLTAVFTPINAENVDIFVDDIRATSLGLASEYVFQPPHLRVSCFLRSLPA
jgi:hypothetical protein